MPKTRLVGAGERRCPRLGGIVAIFGFAVNRYFGACFCSGTRFLVETRRSSEAIDGVSLACASGSDNPVYTDSCKLGSRSLLTDFSPITQLWAGLPTGPH